MRLSSFLPSLLGLVGVAVVASFARDAGACGGCFAPRESVTVVTDHRMALSVSTTQTVLWDQIHYSGDPAEFAWVLPVRQGARVELSRDEWFQALEQTTAPVVYGPTQNRAGCALGGCSADSTSASTAAGGGGVQVLADKTVGPYETVTLRSTDPNALSSWLLEHGYDIPTSIEPVIADYVAKGFDFIALRLVPGCNVRSMQPVRIVTPGADASLPLRMIGAGAGAKVGLTLYVIGEGRYHTKNFPDAVVDWSQLDWIAAENRSNYTELTTAAMGQAEGRAWLTEYAGQPGVVSSGFYGVGLSLFDAYKYRCEYPGSFPSGSGAPSGAGGGAPAPCDRGDAGPSVDSGADASDGNDAGAADDAGQAGDAALSDDASDNDASAAPDAGNDSGTSMYPPYDAAPPPAACADWDDLDVALVGMHASDVWVTRLRADLPNAALAGDLLLEPDTSGPISNVHYATKYAPPPKQAPTASQGCAAVPTSEGTAGGLSLIAMTAFAVSRVMRRKR